LVLFWYQSRKKTECKTAIKTSGGGGGGGDGGLGKSFSGEWVYII